MHLSFVLLVGLSTRVLPNDLDDVLKERQQLIDKELNMMLGHDIVLSDNEQKANEIIMEFKRKQLDDGIHNPEFFNVSKHFFECKEVVKRSPLFKIIQDMPKGAILHAHDTGLLSPDYALKLTYKDDLFVCFEENEAKFLFSSDVPTSTCATAWQLMRDARYSSGNVHEFDQNLRKQFTIVVDEPAEEYPDVNAVWRKFQGYFIKTGALFTYKPIWEMYFYDTLKAMRDDNVMYTEIRSILPPLYDLEGNIYDALDTAEAYKEVVEQFKNDYPDFFGAKLIYAPLKIGDGSTVEGYLKIARRIKAKFPNFLAGFDLVGQEDIAVPLKEFLPQLVNSEFDYFLHAGETNWYGMTDENLFDAIVLGTKRIGHAFAITKHPVLIDEIVKRDIALEVNVVSNAVLKLIEDVRNHPLASFLAQGLPVVLSSDDPGVWEADPLSHDFYYAFVGVASRHADLKMLKKLALNSLYYSTISDKDKALYDFEIRWTKFIDDLLRDGWNSA